MLVQHTNSALLHTYSLVEVIHGVGSHVCSWNSCVWPFSSLRVTSSCARTNQEMCNRYSQERKIRISRSKVSCETCFQGYSMAGDDLQYRPWRSLSTFERRSGGRTHRQVEKTKSDLELHIRPCHFYTLDLLSYPVDGDSGLFRNFGIYLPDYTESHCREE
jgi:hypothetical protein